MSKPTHTLIEITEQLEEAIRVGDYSWLGEFVFKGKQISLDEKDIEERADKFSLKNYSDTAFIGLLGVRAGYKQALLDILKKKK